MANFNAVALSACPADHLSTKAIQYQKTHFLSILYIYIYFGFQRVHGAYAEKMVEGGGGGGLLPHPRALQIRISF